MTYHLQGLGDTGDDVWNAVESKAASSGGGTSKADIQSYGGAAGAVGGAAACTAVGAAAASPLCSVVGGAVGSAITGVIYDIGDALFGSDAPNIDDTWNPRLDAIMHRLSKAFPTVPWDTVKFTFAGWVNAATSMRRQAWAARGSGNQRQAATLMGLHEHYWLYGADTNVGYIDETTQHLYYSLVAGMKVTVTLDYDALGKDIVHGASMAAVDLAKQTADLSLSKSAPKSSVILKPGTTVTMKKTGLGPWGYGLIAVGVGAAGYGIWRASR